MEEIDSNDLEGEVKYSWDYVNTTTTHGKGTEKLRVASAYAPSLFQSIKAKDRIITLAYTSACIYS